MRGTHTASALHALLARLGRGMGALELAIGDRLALLERGDVNVLGYARVRDYVREVLGLQPRLARDLRLLARALWRTPLLRAAVHDGSLPRENAALVVQEATNGNEAAWLTIARRETVRGLRALLGGRAPPEVAWHQLVLSMSADEAVVFLAALDMAGFVCRGGPTTPRWERLAAMCQEFLGGGGGPIAWEVPPDIGAVEYEPGDLLGRCPPGRIAEALRGGEGGAPDPGLDTGGDQGADAAGERGPRRGAGDRDEAGAGDRDAAGSGDRGEAGAGDRDEAGAEGRGEAGADAAAGTEDPVTPEEAELIAELEEELRRFTELTALLAPPGPGVPVRSVEQLDRELRQVTRMHQGFDELVGRLCRLVQTRGTHRAVGYTSSEACCADLLGVSTRTVRSTVALAKKCEQMPELGEAMRSGRLSREKARMISFEATPADVAERIARAAPMTAIELRRSLEAEVDRKMSGGEEVRIPLPEDVMDLVHDTCDLVREKEGRFLPTGTCLALAALYCIGQWEGDARRARRSMGPIRRRDGYRCAVKGCSGPADHEHHRKHRSQGGGNEPSNRISICAPHHLRGFHRGNLRVEGTSPDGLRWWLGKEAVRRSYEEEV